MNPTALGSGARMANAYVLVNSQGVYEGQRATDPDKRVFILTRSAFAGTQRYAAATWSGDVSADWTTSAHPDPCRPQLGALRHPLVDDGHRRFRRAGTSGPGRTPNRRTSRNGAN